MNPVQNKIIIDEYEFKILWKSIMNHYIIVCVESRNIENNNTNKNIYYQSFSEGGILRLGLYIDNGWKKGLHYVMSSSIHMILQKKIFDIWDKINTIPFDSEEVISTIRENSTNGGRLKKAEENNKDLVSEKIRDLNHHLDLFVSQQKCSRRFD